VLASASSPRPRSSNVRCSNQCGPGRRGPFRVCTPAPAALPCAGLGRSLARKAEPPPGSTTSSLSHGLHAPCIASFHSCFLSQRPRPSRTRARQWVVDGLGLAARGRWTVRRPHSVGASDNVCLGYGRGHASLAVARIKLPKFLAPPCLEHSLCSRSWFEVEATCSCLANFWYVRMMPRPKSF